MSTPYLPAGGVCTACGTPFGVGDRFCMSCGASARPLAVAQAPPATTAVLLCGSCGELQEPGDAFCPGCGRSATASPPATPITREFAVPAVGYCERCGGALERDDVFCPSCGRTVAGSSASVTEPIVAPSVSPATAPPAPSRPASPAATAGPVMCPACGVELDEGERFCRSCGRLVRRAGRG